MKNLLIVALFIYSCYLTAISYYVLSVNVVMKTALNDTQKENFEIKADLCK